MKVQSTGLGNTVMVAQFKELLNSQFEDGKFMLLTMEAVQPLHWTIKVYMEPKDIRKAIRIGFKPSIMWKILLASVLGRFSLFPKTGPEKKKSSTASFVNLTEPSGALSSSSEDEISNPLARLRR